MSPKRLEEVANLQDQASRKRYLSRLRIRRASVVQQLNEASRERLRIDPRQALALAEAAVAIARNLPSERDAAGRAFRAKANALYNVGDNAAALDHHERALEIFRETSNQEEQARTLNSSIQPNILLGRYEEALRAAEGARVIFRSTGDARRLGFVEINIGNLYHRQDRFEQALECYQRAYEMLTPLRDSEGLAVTLYNMAVSLISLNDFPRALATYERARAAFVSHGMTLLVVQSDYNIAYLYYLRGEYDRAIELLRATREASEKNGDAHILALCFLDLSEIYLELNLCREAEEIAREGRERFRKLGMGYEEARCLANEAMALSQTGKTLAALELFGKAREIFEREKNRVWPSLVDLYRAVVLFDTGRLLESRRLGKRSAEFFETSGLHGKAALSHLLLARIALASGHMGLARKLCARAIERVDGLESPALRFQAHFLMGQTERASGQATDAYSSLQTARAELETLRSNVRGEELKIAFMKNRLAVYEELVELGLEGRRGSRADEELFSYVELAKSRSLAESLLQPGATYAASDEGQSTLVRRVREMREELNWYYRRIEREQLSEPAPPPRRLARLKEQAFQRENELVGLLRELRSEEASGDSNGGLPSLEAVRAALPPRAILVEYFAVKGRFIAALLSRDGLRILPLSPVARVANLVRLLRFQLAKFALGTGYVRRFEEPLLRASLAHLRELHNELFAPLRQGLEKAGANQLIIVPHGALHSLPFHALLNGETYLIDDFAISYAPSAAVYWLCHRRKSGASKPALVVGVPDERAPLILDEVQRVSEIVQGARLVLGAEAGDEALRESGEDYRLVHIATHGFFRQDNPMFSGIRLGSSYLNLYDLYRLKIDAELATLSGCATGLNVVTAGDELLGLTRGLLYAGAQSLLLTLWDVHDQSTSEFMAAMYQNFRRSPDRAVAFQSALKDVRGRYPHPYYWAPYMLIGKVFTAPANGPS